MDMIGTKRMRNRQTDMEMLEIDRQRKKVHQEMERGIDRGRLTDRHLDRDKNRDSSFLNELFPSREVTYKDRQAGRKTDRQTYSLTDIQTY